MMVPDVLSERSHPLTFESVSHAKRLRVLQLSVVVILGATTAVPLMNYTATGFSIVCFLLAPAYLLSRPTPLWTVTLGLSGVAFVSYAASAFVNDVALSSPGVVSSASFALYFVGACVVAGNDLTAITALIVGVAGGTIAFYWLLGISLTQTGSFADLWKYGIAQPVTIVVVVVSAIWIRHSLAAPAVLVLMAGASLVLNFRSHAFVCLVSAAIMFAYSMFRHRAPRWQIFTGVGVLGLAFYAAVPVVARSGVLGSAIQSKIAFEDNGPTSSVPAILAGRTESPLSLTAIAERPLVGWGTAQNISTDVFVRAKELAVSIGFSPQFPFDLYWYLPNGLVSLHSILLTSWAEGGVLAFFLPVLILSSAGFAVWNNDRFGRWAPLITVVAVQAIWDLAFSPWTYNLLPLYACLCLAAFSRAGRRQVAGSE